jgi:nucleoid-associated protein YgaU/DNA-binding SARP family transcriptional activator
MTHLLEHRSRATLAELARGAAASLLLFALVIGLPVALWNLGSSLQPFNGVGSSDLGSLLTRRDDGSLFLAAVLLVAWVAWLLFTLSVTVELVAFIQGVPTPRLLWLRLPQQGAAALVATAALLVTTGTSLHSAPMARPLSVALVDVGDRPADQGALAVEPKAPSRIRTAAESPNHPTVEVRRHDTLWSLAETHLGSGERYRDIVALNLGRPQPDGRALTNARWIYPGWVLRLPADAIVATRLPSESGATHVVVPGDTLSEIAADELGDSRRYPEIYELNEGQGQVDGRALSDPDEIRPGWRLTLPVADAGSHTGGLASTAPAMAEVPRARVGEVPPRGEPTGGEPAALPTAPRVDRQPATPTDQVHGSDVAVPFGVGLGMLAATGLTWELRRRRRLQQRSRQLGERISMPEDEDVSVEVRVRAAESPLTVETVRQALRALRASCLDSGRQLPDVLLVRVSRSSVSLELRHDDSDAVLPFRAESARRWRLDEPVKEIDSPDPYPALLTLGVDGDDMLLLNLESVGELRLVGPSARVVDLLRAAAVDVAVGALSGGASLTFSGCFGELAQTLDPSRARYVATSQQAGRELAARLEATQRILASSKAVNVLAARSRDVASDATVPDIVVSAEPLQGSPSAWSGSCAIGVGVVSSAEWSVVVDADSRATLQPLGLVFQPQALSQEAFEQVVSLLVTAQTGPGGPAPAADVGEQELVSSALPEVPALVLDLRDNVEPPPRVLVLGRVDVERANEGAVAHRRRRASELIAYLALHPGASGPEIDEALWPGKRVEKGTRNPFISRARQWLGRSPEGEPYLPLVVDGGSYKLRPEVSCDWHDFVRFAKLGLDSGQEGAMALTAALDLVRGRPFLGVDPATYTWAEADAQEMISAIVDVAHVLSAMRCEAGDYRRAQEAAARGLLAEPCSELLYRDAMRAAVAVGDREEVDRLAARLRHEIALVDPEETLDAATIGLLEAVRG